MIVRRGGERVTLSELGLTVIDRASGQYGLGFAAGVDSTSTRIGGVAADSPAARADLGERGRLSAVGGETVSSWFDVSRLLKKSADAGAKTVGVTVARGGDESKMVELQLTDDDRAAIAALRVDALLPLAQLQFDRVTRNPAQAMWWGVRETRDQIVKLYLTLRRVIFDRTVPAVEPDRAGRHRPLRHGHRPARLRLGAVVPGHDLGQPGSRELPADPDFGRRAHGPF